MHLDEFNQLTFIDCYQQLIAVCHSKNWVKKMTDARPFDCVSSLIETAQHYCIDMNEQDILESFSGHATIGDLNVLKDKDSSANKEQGQVADAKEEVLKDLRRLNQEYEAKNGFVFIVCASGKSANEMRGLILERISNSREQELKNGAAEQSKITTLRLERLFNG